MVIVHGRQSCSHSFIIQVHDTRLQTHACVKAVSSIIHGTKKEVGTDKDRLTRSVSRQSGPSFTVG